MSSTEWMCRMDTKKTEFKAKRNRAMAGIVRLGIVQNRGIELQNIWLEVFFLVSGVLH